MHWSRSYLLLAFLLSVISCKKGTEQPQGTNYNVLLKTVTKANFSVFEMTVNYTYNSSGQLTETRTTYRNSTPGTEQQTENFYRNTSGRLDSTRFFTMDNGTPVTTRTFLTYDGSGRIIKSTQIHISSGQTTDSSIYTYAGSTLQQRDDYRSFSGGPFSLLRQGLYTFDGSANLTRAIFKWPAGNIIDTIKFEYDTKINPLPIDQLQFYWAPFFYNDYKPANNPTLQFTNAAESFTNEYTYAPNNKPLYRKSKVIGSNTSFYETWYYYD